MKLSRPAHFQRCALFMNGQRVAIREQAPLWWFNDDRFAWDVDVSAQIQAGRNAFDLACDCAHHMCGLFHRPFLYQSKSQ